MVASADDKDWMETSFNNVRDVIARHRNQNAFARSPWTSLAVQLAGVIVGFILCLWISVKLTPSLKIENALAITFIFFFLLFSNAWGYLNAAILALIAKFFPNVKFVRSEAPLHWFWTAMITTVFIMAVGYLFKATYTFLNGFFATLLR